MEQPYVSPREHFWMVQVQVRRCFQSLLDWISHWTTLLPAKKGATTTTEILVGTPKPWPTHDPAMLVDDEIEIPVQVLGKVRARITVPRDSDKKALEEAAMSNERIQELIAGKTIRKVIVVPGKLVNIVAN